MAASTTAKKSPCATCEKNTGIFTCGGCTRAFCTKHASEHRQMLGQQMDEIVFEHDQLCQNINEQIDGIQQCPSMKEIDEWERQSIDKISQIAENARQKLKERTQYIQTSVRQLAEKLNRARMEDDFVETDLNLWSDKINKLKTDISTSIPIVFQSIDDDLIRFTSQPHSQDQVNSTINITSFASTPSEDHSHPRVIELLKTGEGLGFHVMGGENEIGPIYISHIIPNSVAWKHGGLKKGDQILSVNGISVENEYHDTAVNLLKQAQGSVKLVVHYSPQLLIEMENRLEKQRTSRKPPGAPVNK